MLKARVSIIPVVLLVAGCTNDPSGNELRRPSTGSSIAAPDDDDESQEGEEPVTNEVLQAGEENRAGMEEPEAAEDPETDPVLAKYTNIDPEKVVPKSLRDDALRYFDKNTARLPNAKFITVVDMAQHSKNKRFYLIDMETGSVEQHVVAHGTGSDPENDGTPSKFSNVSGSNATSLGFYKTAETYEGKWGYSLRLDGLSSTNSNARARAVVMHGASYVENGRAKQGRSWGCPAIPLDEKDAVIDKVKGGSLLYVGQQR